MSSRPRFSRPESQEIAAAPVEILAVSNDSPKTTWRRLLRPGFLETSVLVVDILLIVVAGLACSAAYHEMTAGDAGNVAPYVGMGIVVAVNFAAIMTARRNYRLKRLVL